MAAMNYQKPSRFMMTYFKHPNVTITLVTGDSFSKLEPRHPKEVFIVYDDWYPADPQGEVAAQRTYQDPNPRHLYFLSNTREIHEIRLAHGFNSHFVNVGCFVDDAVFSPSVLNIPKEFDAVMNGRFTTSNDGVELKRHFLTDGIPRLALLDPVFQSNNQELKQKYVRRCNCKFHNVRRLRSQLVCEIYRRSHCGLILSELEGICRASSEYLLAGIPVISTPSTGGRDVWYDDYNSIIAEPTVEAVSQAVEMLRSTPRDAHRIRKDYQDRAMAFKARFRDEVLRPILKAFQIDVDAEQIMQKYPFRWYPDQPRIFPDPDRGEDMIQNVVPSGPSRPSSVGMLSLLK